MLSRIPRTLTLLASLLAVAVLVGAIAPSAAAPAPEPTKKDEPKKEEPKPPAPDFFPLPDLEKLLPPGAIDPEQMKELQKMMEEIRKQFGQMQRGGFVVPNVRLRNPFGVNANMESRMGASLQSPSATIVDQLNLPEKQGVVLQEVKPDSAAAKAGLKNHDILLELDGKPVPSDLDDFHKMLKGIKPDTAVDAVVLRKGKKETIKGLKLPEAKEEPNPFRGLQRLPILPGGNLPLPGGLPGGVRMQNLNMIRNADGSFTSSTEENGVKLTVTGKVENGKANVSEIEVKDGTESKKYKSVEEVPEAHREAVKNLIQMSEGRGGFRFNLRKQP
jgi:membrane-associated protease RseP (regulator of RpoE activity)